MRRFKHERKYNIGNSELGRAGEYRVAAELILRGHMVYLPSVDNGIDLVIDNGLTIQIKSRQKQPFKCRGYGYMTYSFGFHKSYSKTKKPQKVHVLPNALNVDYVICWAIDDDEFYIIPADKIRGKVSISFTADEDRRTQVKWNKWLPYRNAWELLDGKKLEEIEPLEELECKQCGHKWLPLTPNPTRCPKCHNRWYLDKYEHTCKRCGHTWSSKLEHPIWCPRCHSYIWDKEKLPLIDYPLITCVRCGYTWKPIVERPQRCPSCHVVRYLGKEPKPYHIVCQRCGYEWDSSKENPTQCLKCHSRKWNRLREVKELVTV